MPAIRGHFVPKFLLQGFTIGGGEYDDLFVLDKRRQRQWESSPFKAAKERGMYAVDYSDPEIMEKAMGEAESMFSDLLAETLETAKLPTGKAWTEFLGFVSTMVVRTPSYRDRYWRMTNAMLAAMTQCQLSTVEGREQFAGLMRDCGVDPAMLPAEEFRAWVDEGIIELMATPNGYMHTLASNAGGLVPVLAERQWALWTCADDSPDLVCSDHPVAVTLNDDVVPPTGFGLGTRGTYVSFALSRRAVMFGAFDGPTGLLRLNREDVASLNTATLIYANQVYSATTDFIWKMKDGRIGSTQDLLDLYADD